MSHYGTAVPRMREAARGHLLRFLRALPRRAAGHRLPRRAVLGERRGGVWRFNWLPVHSPAVRSSRGPGSTVPQRLAARLGLENLHVAFNGYWPERGALLETCTFKEFEASVVLQNARENGVEGLTVASAGNTARAFAYLSAQTGYPVVIVVPAMCLTEMWYHERSLDVPTVVVADGDYSDSIDVARGWPRPSVSLRGRRQERREARRPRPGAARGGGRARAGSPTTTSRRWAAAPARSASGRWPSASSPTGASARACRCCTSRRTCRSRRWRRPGQRGERRLEPRGPAARADPRDHDPGALHALPGVRDRAAACMMRSARPGEACTACATRRSTRRWSCSSAWRGSTSSPRPASRVAALGAGRAARRAAPGRARAAERHRRRREAT